MFLEIPDVLTAPEIERLRVLAKVGRFVDGRLSSPHSTVKNNLQVDHADPAYSESSKLMAGALQRSEAFRNFAFPRIMAPPMLAKYVPGMAYGAHSDAAFIPLGARPLRSDVSCTVWIADPQTYDGGELSVQLGAAAVAFKGAPGSAIVYPSHFLHEVKPVTRGERLVGITFIESAIPVAAHRELLYHLDEVAALEGFNISPENRTRLQFVRNNLRRMWGEAE
ncbi:MAG TPA: Fe2+-dependent dioxygenase [Caulobacteraceae bacterium]|nr:Fe2+-dependent dioxygenase [Caulobacteraceae bacterium]